MRRWARIGWLGFCTLQLYGAEVVPIAVQVATVSRVQTEYLVLVFTNASGWHTYYKDPGEVGLPFQFSFTRGDQPVSMALSGWPQPIEFVDSSGFHSKGYTGEYAFFFSLPSTEAKMKEAELFHLTVKGLACGDRCIPQRKLLEIRWQQGRWAPATGTNGVELLPKRASQFWAAQVPYSEEILAPLSHQRSPTQVVGGILLAIVGIAGGILWRKRCFRPSANS